MRKLYAAAAVVLTALAGFTAAQAQRSTDDCSDTWSGGRNRQYRHCEVRDYTLPGSNPLNIDAGMNGGIRVTGWDRPEVTVRAKIQAYARTEADARRVAAGVRVEAAGTTVRVDGEPGRNDDENWAVNFDIHAPRNAMLTLYTHNGGITLDDLHGAVKFHARNGGVSLTNVGGDIRG